MDSYYNNNNSAANTNKMKSTWFTPRKQQSAKDLFLPRVTLTDEQKHRLYEKLGVTQYDVLAEERY